MTSTDQLYAVLEDTQRLYRRSIHASWVFPYLFKRQIADAITGGQLGYAPQGHAQTWDYLTQRGHAAQAILDAGVATIPDHTRRPVRDVMRDRLTFPIHDQEGRVIGFLGRSAPQAPEFVPKYLNTPTTALYSKGATLYGLAEQVDQIAAGVPPLLVEGPLDRWAIHHAGDRIPPVAPVAPCGTAVTEDQLRDLARLARGPILVCFDPDDAGRAAALRLWGTAREAIPQHPIHLVQLPGSADPAQLVQRGRYGTLSASLEHATPLAHAALDAALGQTPATNPVHAASIVSSVARRDIAAIGPQDRAAYVLHVSRRLRLTAAEATALVTGAVANAPPMSSAITHHAPVRRFARRPQSLLGLSR